MARTWRAGLEDVAAVAALRRSWVEELAGRPSEDDGFEQRLADWFEREHHQRVTWLADEGGPCAGMLNLLLFTRMPKPARPVSRWGYVANVYVVAGHRDAGIGRQLLDACLGFAREEGLVRLVLSPSERSVPFYARAGFVPATGLMVRELP